MIGMIDWASWGTAVGTLVLAVATFASVRAGNRAGRNAERAFQAGLRPVLFASRPHETVQKVRWGHPRGGGRRRLHGPVAAERRSWHRCDPRLASWCGPAHQPGRIS